MEIKTSKSLEKEKNKEKINDMEASSSYTQDSNLLKNEKEELKLKIEDLTKIVNNFTNGKKKLDRLLSSQRCVFDKASLGYNPITKQKQFQNFFVKDNPSEVPICDTCGKMRHTIYTSYKEK